MPRCTFWCLVVGLIASGTAPGSNEMHAAPPRTPGPAAGAPRPQSATGSCPWLAGNNGIAGREPGGAQRQNGPRDPPRLSQTAPQPSHSASLKTPHLQPPFAPGPTPACPFEQHGPIPPSQPAQKAHLTAYLFAPRTNLSAPPRLGADQILITTYRRTGSNYSDQRPATSV